MARQLPDLSPIEQVLGIMKRFLVQWYGMRTPLTIQQLERAVFEAYNTINWMSIGVLALSAKYRVQLCLERGGHFIGDAIDECCRRAKIELETQTDIIFLSVYEEAHESFHADDAWKKRLNSTDPVSQRALCHRSEDGFRSPAWIPSVSMIEC